MIERTLLIKKGWQGACFEKKKFPDQPWERETNNRFIEKVIKQALQ